ncbi:MAG: Bax inhibitor-1 family protein [Lachnospiraceae bacterium]|nr:Bax inhibitor-1 family protein [Lachnospiraceae bacterium]
MPENNFNLNKKKGVSIHVDYLTQGAEISFTAYQAIIGGLLTYGFLLDTFLVLRFSDAVRRFNPILFLILYFAAVLTGSFLLRSKNVLMGFVGYNLIAIPIGLVLAGALPGYPSALIARAVLMTAGITILMTIASMLFPAFFARLGPALFISLLVLIIVELIAMLFGYRGGIFDYLVCGIFSLYLGFDWYRASNIYRTPTNALIAAANLYLDIINIFMRILRILGRRD